MEEEDESNLKKKKRKRGNNSIHNRKPIRLKCSVQNYDWGVVGDGSHVSRLYSLNSGLRNIDRGKPYAEFWIGTHESGPSYVVRGSDDSGRFDSKGLSLRDWISEDPVTLVGEKVAKKWGNDLPFLFKVISVEKVLSIQAHPDEEMARALHKSHPNFYKDENHKPEMALALTEFEALCGFISPKELKELLSNVPEIVELVGGSVAEQFVNASEKEGNDEVIPDLASIFSQVMTSNKGSVQNMVSKLKKRLHLEREKRELTVKEELVLKLEGQYPDDVGLIAAFFLNYVKLNCGEALYLGPNEPHAYISGECIECMAASDNVVRAGLTSKRQDIPTLLSMLTYKQVGPFLCERPSLSESWEEIDFVLVGGKERKMQKGFPEILPGVPLNPYTKRYLPPFDEFEVDRCILPPAVSVAFPSLSGPSLFLCIAGKGTIISSSSMEDYAIEEGDVLFVPPSIDISITSSMELQVYRAGVNSRFFED